MDILIKNLELPEKHPTFITLYRDGSVSVCTPKETFYTEAEVVEDSAGRREQWN